MPSVSSGDRSEPSAALADSTAHPYKSLEIGDFRQHQADMKKIAHTSFFQRCDKLGLALLLPLHPGIEAVAILRIVREITDILLNVRRAFGKSSNLTLSPTGIEENSVFHITP